MNYRKLGKTGLMVSEIGLGGEWLERHNADEVKAVIDCCEEAGSISNAGLMLKRIISISPHSAPIFATAGLWVLMPICRIIP